MSGDLSRVRICSDGSGPTTVVMIDGRPAPNVIAVEWRCDADSLATAVVTFDNVRADIDGVTAAGGES